MAIGRGQWRSRRVSLPATVDELRSRKVDDEIGLVGDVADEAAEMGGGTERNPGDRRRRAFQDIRDALTGECRVGLGEPPVAERRTALRCFAQYRQFGVAGRFIDRLPDSLVESNG